MLLDYSREIRYISGINKRYILKEIPGRQQQCHRNFMVFILYELLNYVNI